MKNASIPVSEISRKLFEHLETGVFGDSIVVILNVGINIFLELADFQVMVTLVVRIHFDPVVPVELPDAHGDVSLSMSEGTIDLRFGSIEVEALEGSW
jgi:hypothetical protein